MSLNKNKIIVFILLLLIAATNAWSQEEIVTEDLEEVVVTATRTVRQLSSLPLPVTLVSKKQLQQSGVTRLNEILNEQTGLVITPDATIGGGEGVQIQGIASDYVMVLLDGVPVVGRSGGNLDLSRLAVGNIKQIEIVKGPSSSLFGSEALGGVINIITEQPKTKMVTGQLSHRAATFNHQNTAVTLNQKINKLGYSLFLDRLSSDGYDLAPTTEGQTINPFYNYTANARMFYTFSERLKLFFSGRYFLQDFEVPSGTSEERDGNLHLRLDHTLNAKSELAYELYYTNYLTNEESFDPINNDLLLANDFNQKLFRPEVRFNHTQNNANTLTLGVGYSLEMLDRSLFAAQVRFDSQYAFAQYDMKAYTRPQCDFGSKI